MGDETLSLSWRSLIQSPENQKVVSIVSLWEIAIKTNIGKLSIQYPFDQLIPAEFQLLPIELPICWPIRNSPSTTAIRSTES